MDDDRLKIREKLASFAFDLKALTFPTSPIPIESAQFVASALESYLDGKSKSLDAAFGLTPKRGAPRKQEIKKLIAREFLKKELEGKPVQTILDELSEEMSRLHQYDDREVRRIRKEYEVLTMSEELGRRRSESDKKK
jgi:hypothetical protein